MSEDNKPADATERAKVLTEDALARWFAILDAGHLGKSDKAYMLATIRSLQSQLLAAQAEAAVLLKDLTAKIGPSYTKRMAASTTPLAAAFIAEHERLKQAQEWQPIETAPKDESVLLATTGGWVGEARLSPDFSGDDLIWYWVWAGGIRLHENLVPLGWMPLPLNPHDS